MTLEEVIRDVLSRLQSAVEKALGDEYSVTIILHTREGDPEDGIVASTGSKATALPSLSAAATDSEQMEEIVAMPNQDNENHCSCGVPKDLHATACGWGNAHVPLSDLDGPVPANPSGEWIKEAARRAGYDLDKATE